MSDVGRKCVVKRKEVVGGRLDLESDVREGGWGNEVRWDIYVLVNAE